MKKYTSYAATLAIFTMVLAMGSCKKEQAAKIDKTPPSEEVTVENVSYNNFTGKLLQSKCSSCHSAGEQASSNWTFSGFNSAKSNGARINQAVLVSRTMPMGGSLTVKERELLEAWFKRNMPEN